MLELKNIGKVFKEKKGETRVLENISLSFKETGLVLICGESGSGKTLLLNIIACLERPTEGSYIIMGKDSALMNDKELSEFRNRILGIVHRGSKLVPNLSLRQNVELRLALSGAEVEERKEKALKILESMGIGELAERLPGTVSSIERAIAALAAAMANDPSVIIIDEPEFDEGGELFWGTLKKLSKEKLIILSSGATEEAKPYVDRIIGLRSGRLCRDEKMTGGELTALSCENSLKKKTDMPLGSAANLAAENFRGRSKEKWSKLVAMAVSIFCLTLTLAIVFGFYRFLRYEQERAIIASPIVLESAKDEKLSLKQNLLRQREITRQNVSHGREAVYGKETLGELLRDNTFFTSGSENLELFAKYMEEENNPIRGLMTGYAKLWDAKMTVLTKASSGEVRKVNLGDCIEKFGKAVYGETYGAALGHEEETLELGSFMAAGSDGELVHPLIKEQYELLYGSWPTKYDEIVLFLDENNEISDLGLFGLGLISEQDIIKRLKDSVNGDGGNTIMPSWNYGDICAKQFKLVMAWENYFYDSATNTYKDVSDTVAGIEQIFGSQTLGEMLKISGIVRPCEGCNIKPVSGSIGYTYALMEHLEEKTADAGIIKEQLKSPERDLVSGLPFRSAKPENEVQSTLAEEVSKYISGLGVAKKAVVYTAVASEMSDGEAELMAKDLMKRLNDTQLKELFVDMYSEEMGVSADKASAHLGHMDAELMKGYLLDKLIAHERQKRSDSVRAELAGESSEQLAAKLGEMELADWQLEFIKKEFLPPTETELDLKERLDSLGYMNPERPDSILIYAENYRDKEAVVSHIRAYNSEIDREKRVAVSDSADILSKSLVSDILTAEILLVFLFINMLVIAIFIMSSTVPVYIGEAVLVKSMGASEADIKHIMGIESIFCAVLATGIGVPAAFIVSRIINFIIRNLVGPDSMSVGMPYYIWLAVFLGAALIAYLTGAVKVRIINRRSGSIINTIK